MPPLPKKKYPSARQGKRRSHLALSLPSLDRCPQCHSLKLAHHVCTTCGNYKNRQVTEVKKTKKKSS